MSKLEELERDTKSYWELSLAFNGRLPSSKTTVEKAIGELCKVLDRTNSIRKLAAVSNVLLDDIIGNSASHKKKRSNNKPIKIKEDQISSL